MISFVANGLAREVLDENKGEKRIQGEVACELGMFWGFERGIFERKDVLEDSVSCLSQKSVL